MSVLWIGTLVGVALFLFAGLSGNLKALLSLSRLPKLSEVEPDLEVWPRLSLVCAACNEEETVEAAAKTLLALDYPDLELIFVNDRSTDATGEILDRLDAQDERLSVVHIEELPEGWLGKVHALHRGTQEATGEYLVYTDADVHFAPKALHRAVALCEREGLGHLTVMPRLYGNTLGINALISVFAVGYLGTLDAHKIGQEDSDAYAGVGAFGMVRTSDFRRTKGWEWLRMELSDDVGLGMMMVQQAGARSLLAAGAEQLEVMWYEDIPSMVSGMEKNAFPVMGRFRVGLTWMMGLVLMSVPPVVLASLFLPVVWAISLLFLLSFLPLAWSFSTTLRHPVLATLVGLVVYPALGWLLLNSMFKTRKAGGISWRGTFYSLEALKAGQRITF